MIRRCSTKQLTPQTSNRPTTGVKTGTDAVRASGFACKCMEPPKDPSQETTSQGMLPHPVKRAQTSGFAKLRDRVLPSLWVPSQSFETPLFGLEVVQCSFPFASQSFAPRPQCSPPGERQKRSVRYCAEWKPDVGKKAKLPHCSCKPTEVAPSTAAQDPHGTTSTENPIIG